MEESKEPQPEDKNFDEPHEEQHVSMKKCSACNNLKPPGAFSKSQLKKKDKRRCRDCIEVIEPQRIPDLKPNGGWSELQEYKAMEQAFHRGAWHDCIAKADEALKKIPPSEVAIITKCVLHQAEAFMELDEPREALEKAKEALGRTPSKEALLVKALLVKGRALFCVSDYGGAVCTFRQAEELIRAANPQDQKTCKPVLLDAMLGRARSLLEQNKFEEARECAKIITDVDATFDEGWVCLGDSYLGLNELDDAIASYRRGGSQAAHAALQRALDSRPPVLRNQWGVSEAVLKYTTDYYSHRNPKLHCILQPPFGASLMEAPFEGKLPVNVIKGNHSNSSQAVFIPARDISKKENDSLSFILEKIAQHASCQANGSKGIVVQLPEREKVTGTFEFVFFVLYVCTL